MEVSQTEIPLSPSLGSREGHTLFFRKEVPQTCLLPISQEKKHFEKI